MQILQHPFSMKFDVVYHMQCVTIIHLCSAHMIYLVMKKVRKHVFNRSLVRFFSNCLGLLVTAQDMEFANKIFEAITSRLQKTTAESVGEIARQNMKVATQKTSM